MTLPPRTPRVYGVVLRLDGTEAPLHHIHVLENGELVAVSNNRLIHHIAERVNAIEGWRQKRNVKLTEKATNA